MEAIEFGRYRLVRRIAQGGMAQIFLAVQRGPHGFEKVAVLKVILAELCTNDDFVQMFLDEARIAANLDHNNVVRVYDFGEIDGRYYIAMEHLAGEDLASVLQASKRAKQRIPIDPALDMIIGAATGLHFAHELKDPRGRPMNVVHRDVSPSNIIVTYQGTVKLVDFGIARAESNITKTAAGTFKGKVAYVSPEQAAGDPLDRRADVFALGVVAYELLTGERIFKRESDLATLQAVLSGPIPNPSQLRPEIPAALDPIILKALARNVDERYPSCADFAEALAGYLVSTGYVRSEKRLADYMMTLFDAERRDAKLLISQSASLDGGPVMKTPSALNRIPHLSPLRSHPTMPSVSIEVPIDPTAVQNIAPKQGGRGLLIGGALLVAALVAGIVVLLLRNDRPSVVEIPVPATPLVVAPAPVPVEPPKPAPPAVEPAPVVEAVKPVEPVKPAPVAKVARGKLTLDTQPYTEVFLNGRRLGDTPLVELPLPAGIHTLKLVNDAKGLHNTIEVEIVAGKTTVKKLKL